MYFRLTYYITRSSLKQAERKLLPCLIFSISLPAPVVRQLIETVWQAETHVNWLSWEDVSHFHTALWKQRLSMLLSLHRVQITLARTVTAPVWSAGGPVRPTAPRAPLRPSSKRGGAVCCAAAMERKRRRLQRRSRTAATAPRLEVGSTDAHVVLNMRVDESGGGHNWVWWCGVTFREAGTIWAGLNDLLQHTCN